MNDLREQLARVIDPDAFDVSCDEVFHAMNQEEALRVADAIIAALPGMVQPLVWDIDWRGRSFNSIYTIWEFPLGFSVEHGQDGETITNPLKTLEAAKAAAQAHRAAAVLAALGLTHQPQHDTPTP